VNEVSTAGGAENEISAVQGDPQQIAPPPKTRWSRRSAAGVLGLLLSIAAIGLLFLLPLWATQDGDAHVNSYRSDIGGVLALAMSATGVWLGCWSNQRRVRLLVWYAAVGIGAVLVSAVLQMSILILPFLALPTWAWALVVLWFELGSTIPADRGASSRAARVAVYAGSAGIFLWPIIGMWAGLAFMSSSGSVL